MLCFRRRKQGVRIAQAILTPCFSVNRKFHGISCLKKALCGMQRCAYRDFDTFSCHDFMFPLIFLTLSIDLWKSVCYSFLVWYTKYKIPGINFEEKSINPGCGSRENRRE